MKAEEIRNMTVEEMQGQLEEQIESMGNLQVQHASRQLNTPLQLRTVRRDIARLKTILAEQTVKAGPETEKPKAENKE